MKYEGKSIFFIGDSITANGLFFKYLRTYFKRAGRDVTIYNKGIPGGTLTILHTALDEELRSGKPDFAVISFGANDSRYWEYNSDTINTPELTQTIDNQRRIYAEKMELLVEKLSALGITPILTSPFAFSHFLSSSENVETVVDAKEKACINHKFYNREVFAKINGSLKEYRDFVKNFAEERGIEFWDNYEATYSLSDSLDYASDGIHFSPKGNQLIARLILGNMLGEELNEFNTDEETEKLAASELEERAYFFIKYNIMRPTNPNWTPDELQERVKAWIERKGNVEGVTKVREEAFYRYIAKLKKA